MSRAHITHPGLAFTTQPRNCDGRPDINWYPDRGPDTTNAVATCAGCPQLAPCREWGIRHEQYGTWGGLNQWQRARERRRRGIELETPGADRKAACGTRSGYVAHRSRGEDCPACREANAIYQAGRKEVA